MSVICWFDYLFRCKYVFMYLVEALGLKYESIIREILFSILDMFVKKSS